MKLSVSSSVKKSVSVLFFERSIVENSWVRRMAHLSLLLFSMLASSNWVEAKTGRAAEAEKAPRIDGVIGERIERLNEQLREMLTLASVEGESFTAEVLARLRKDETRDVVRLLSRELEKRHRLVSARGILRLSRERLSLYRFWHILFFL